MKIRYFLLTILLFTLALSGNSQSYRLTFFGAGASNIVESVTVENIDQGQVITFEGNDTLILSGNVNTHEIESFKDRGLFIFPNPAADRSIVEFDVDKSQKASVSVYDLAGREIITRDLNLKKGHCSFEISGLPSGVLIVCVKSEWLLYSGKLISNSKSHGPIRINLLTNPDERITKKVVAKSGSQVTIPYHDGELLLIKCYSGSYSSVQTLIPIHDVQVIANFVPCTDSDGRSYGTLTANIPGQGREFSTSQVWMTENLNVGERINGSTISTDNNIIEKYCFNDDESNCDMYGGLYMWDEAMQYSMVEEAQGLCPEGFHIPTHMEWCLYENYLDNTVNCNTGWLGYDVAHKLRAHYGWPLGTNSNSSGFTALPGGVKAPNGEFPNYIGSATWFWTSSELDDTISWARQIYCTGHVTDHSPYTKPHGFSIRCISDNTLATVTTSNVMNISQTYATAGGSVVSDGGEVVSLKGVCWSTFPNPTISDQHTTDGSGAGQFVSILDNLEANTLYYVKAYAINDLGIAYGNEVSFVTNATGLTLPTVTTEEVANTGQHTAIANGIVYTDGGETVFERGFCWDTIQQPTIEDNIIDSGTGIGAFSGILNGLELNTVYHVRAYATNILGTSYGSDVVFTSLPSDEPCGGMESISYQGQTYELVEINYDCWFKENINVGEMLNIDQPQLDNGIIEKYCFDNDPQKCEEFGGFYLWNEAMQYTTVDGARGVCPEGWHVSSETDWYNLATYVGGYHIAGRVLKDQVSWGPDCIGTNQFGFTGIRIGQDDNSPFCCGGTSVYFTSSLFSEDNPYARVFGCQDELSLAYGGTIFAFPLRCVKNR